MCFIKLRQFGMDMSGIMRTVPVADKKNVSVLIRFSESDRGLELIKVRTTRERSESVV